MDSLYFDLLRFGYHFGLAVLIGGGIVIGAAAAPGVFTSIKSRGDAANVFGAILGRYDGMAMLALVVVGLTTVLKFFGFEEDLRDWRLWARFIGLAGMSVSALFAVGYAGPVARSIRRETPGFDDLPEGDVRRREFRAMHRKATMAHIFVLAFGSVALFFS